MTLQAGDTEGGYGAPAAGGSSGESATPASAPASSAVDDGSETLAIGPIALGALALLAALGPLAATRRGRSSSRELVRLP